MKYKALMLDIDGTILPYTGYVDNAVPSPKVTKAIQKAQAHVTVCLATGRSFYRIHRILEHLKLQGIVIANDGSIVINAETGEKLYEQYLLDEDISSVQAYFVERKIPLLAGTAARNYKPDESFPKSLNNLFTEEHFSQSQADTLVHDLSKIPTIHVVKYRHDMSGRYGVIISHAAATKQHGITKAIKALNISHEKIIGVGDGYNDFPLLLACGLKVAMGNAVPELKAIADYVAPTVYDDGVADVIEKYVLRATE